MRIRVVVPVANEWQTAAARMVLSAAAGPDTELDVVCLGKGLPSVESRYEKALVVPAIIAMIVQAEGDGMDAVMVDCMMDAGVAEGREMVSIPVVGPAETCMHIAAMLAHRFSIVQPLERMRPAFDDLAARTGTTLQLASVRAMDIPVLELNDHERLLGALVDESVKAVREDGAHAIVFGCTFMTGLAQEVQDRLSGEGITDVPVIDPPVLALKITEAVVKAGLSHSKRTYPVPPQKETICAFALGEG